jgi:hypothetical protein
VSETSEETPKRYQVRGAYIYARVPNGMVGWAGRSKWQVSGFPQNAMLPPEIHPDDLAHLLTLTVDGKLEGDPMLVEFPAG